MNILQMITAFIIYLYEEVKMISIYSILAVIFLIGITIKVLYFKKGARENEDGQID